MTAPPFPVYDVPAFVAARFPEFDPADPSTWPEPDRCTDGRPWGHDAYSYGLTGNGRDHERMWEWYLQDRSRRCRNRWRDPGYRLCGTHLRTFVNRIESDRKRLARNARELEYRDLAKRLAAHGIEGDAGSNGVLLRRDAVEGLLRLLERPEPAAWPSTDLSVPPPL